MILFTLSLVFILGDLPERNVVNKPFCDFSKEEELLNRKYPPKKIYTEEEFRKANEEILELTRKRIESVKSGACIYPNDR